MSFVLEFNLKECFSSFFSRITYFQIHRAHVHDDLRSASATDVFVWYLQNPFSGTRIQVVVASMIYSDFWVNICQFDSVSGKWESSIWVCSTSIWTYYDRVINREKIKYLEGHLDLDHHLDHKAWLQLQLEGHFRRGHDPWPQNFVFWRRKLQEPEAEKPKPWNKTCLKAKRLKKIKIVLFKKEIENFENNVIEK